MIFERPAITRRQFFRCSSKKLTYKNVVVNQSGSRMENNEFILYVDISPADEAIAVELLNILEKDGIFTCDPITKNIVN